MKNKQNLLSLLHNPLFLSLRKGLVIGTGIALGAFGTTLFAVAVTGTIKTWTSQEVLKASDLNTTIASLKTAIEGIPDWSKNGTNAVYTAGNVGIGTSSPGAEFFNNSRFIQVTGDNAGSIVFERSNTTARKWEIGVTTQGHFDFADVKVSTSDPRMRINSSGDVGIGTSSPTQKLTVNGNAGNTTGVWVTNSDFRLKKNIEPLPSLTDKLDQLRPVTFEWKDPKSLGASEGKHIGFIAQEVEKVFPNWVDTDKTGFKWLNMEGANAVFVKTFQELHARTKELELHILNKNTKVSENEKAINQKIAKLEEENVKLKAEIASFESKLDRILAQQPADVITTAKR